LRAFESLCQEIEVGYFDLPIWIRAAELFATLRQKGTPIGDENRDADILIAAYCLENQCTLVTDNERHFARIEGLEFTNWKH
jgi:predicted nucleic acid-binding protein